MVKLHTMKDDIKSIPQHRNTVLSIETDYKDKSEDIKNTENDFSNDASRTINMNKTTAYDGSITQKNKTNKFKKKKKKKNAINSNPINMMSNKVNFGITSSEQSTYEVPK